MSPIFLLAAAATILATTAGAQTVDYTVTTQQTNVPVLFGVAAYKICQIKDFVFAMFYILSVFAFIVMAVKWVFIKFDIKNLLTIVGGIFILATSDLLIDFISGGGAYYCPSMIG